MSVEKLSQVIVQQTRVYRKGEPVVEEAVGAVHVTTIDAMPATPDRGRLVDVHFINVGFTEYAANKHAFLDALRDATANGGGGVYADLTVERLAGGPSYIEVGAWLGSQELALMFFGLCEFHEVGKVITPATLGIEGAEAKDLAGRGMVFCPLDREAVAA